MINWIAGNWFEADGNSPWKCLVSHDGVFENTLDGLRHRGTLVQRVGTRRHTVRQSEGLRAVQPGEPRIAKWKVPMLVVQGQLDFRIPVEQGIALFIDSKFLYFPDALCSSRSAGTTR
jgi:hypothetical protein